MGIADGLPIVGGYPKKGLEQQGDKNRRKQDEEPL
jgi:hypothetical protein